MATPVIFRKWKPRRVAEGIGEEGGEVIALFPTVPGSSPWDCNSYMHIGQHGTADPYLFIRETVLAKPHEYGDLLEELRSYGDGHQYGDLKVYHRVQPRMHEERDRTWHKWERAATEVAA